MGYLYKTNNLSEVVNFYEVVDSADIEGDSKGKPLIFEISKDLLNKREVDELPLDTKPISKERAVLGASLGANQVVDGFFVKVTERSEEYLDKQFAYSCRLTRDYFLSRLDPVVSNPLRFAELTDKQKGEVVAYRQALLDVPQQDDFPIDIIWPAMPTFLSSEYIAP